MYKNFKFLISTSLLLGSLLMAGASQAQNHEKYPGNKKIASPSLDVDNAQAPATGNTAVLNPEMASQKRGAITATSNENSGKSCTPLQRENPYAISRKDFNKLPIDRQRFLLENGNKYTIID
jgi:hypothetical protein